MGAGVSERIEGAGQERGAYSSVGCLSHFTSIDHESLSRQNTGGGGRGAGEGGGGVFSVRLVSSETKQHFSVRLVSSETKQHFFSCFVSPYTRGRWDGWSVGWLVD